MLDNGTRLAGRYLVLSPLAKGGMGEVYRARDLRLERDVAIKVLAEDLVNDSDLKARFEREAKVLANLSHPNILTLYDFLTDQGLSFAVTELLEGETLRGRLQRSSLPWEEAVTVGIAIAEGLAAAHSRGIIHRDLKPDNVFFTTQGQVKILDFGLAHMEKWPESPQPPGLSPTASLLTEPGTVLGTLQYMSPEQLRGQGTDARTDLFSFGSMLYEMVTGTRPFSRNSVADTMVAILKEDPLDCPALEKEVPAQLLPILLRLLKKDSAQRFQSAGEVAEQLKLLKTPTEKRQGVRFPDIFLTSFPFRLFLLILLLAAAAGIYVLSGHGGAIESIAVLPFENMAADPESDYLSDGMTESITDNLAQIPAVRVIARGTTFRFKGHSEDPQTIGRKLKVDAVLTGGLMEKEDNLIVRADLLRVSDDTQLWGKSYNNKKADILQVQENILREIAARLRVKLTGEQEKRLAKAYTDNTEAYHLYLKGRYHLNKRTPDRVQKAIDYFHKAIRTDPNYALAYAGLSDCYIVSAGYDILPPQEAYSQAEQAAATALQKDEELAEAHTSLALISMYHWRWEKAEKEFKRALELNPGYASAHHWYANYLMVRNKQQEGLAEIRKALDLDPLSLVINTAAGWHLYLARQYNQAIEQERRALELDPNFAAAHAAIAEAYVQKGRAGEAVEEFQDAIRLSGGVTDYTAELGHAFAVFGKENQALQIVDSLKHQSGKEYVSDVYVSMIFAGLGRKDEAFGWLEKAYQRRSDFLIYVPVEPRFQSLRHDPRFKELMKQIGLSP